MVSAPFKMSPSAAPLSLRIYELEEYRKNREAGLETTTVETHGFPSLFPDGFDFRNESVHSRHNSHLCQEQAGHILVGISMTTPRLDG